jgi:Tol biopolymer transport system component
MWCFALLTLIVLSAAGCGGSKEQDTEQESATTGRIAFVREDQVWVMNANGSSQRKLIRGRRGTKSSPAWSPTG